MSFFSNAFQKFFRNWKIWCACAVVFFLLNVIYLLSQVNRSSKASSSAINDHAADSMLKSLDKERGVDVSNSRKTKNDMRSKIMRIKNDTIRSADSVKNRISSMTRGADPSHIIHKLVQNGIGSEATFTCLDGLKKLSLRDFNDDFCDCVDGSDEPGTNACNNGRFYCSVEEKFIHSTYVNDGICDCCNGEDEWMNSQPLYILPRKFPSKKFVPCPNTCGG